MACKEPVLGHGSIYFALHTIFFGGLGGEGSVIYKSNPDCFSYTYEAAGNQLDWRYVVLRVNVEMQAVKGEEAVEVIVWPVRLGRVGLQDLLP